jgi:hypothetical protein
MIARHSSEAYVCSMEASAVPADRSPKCTVLGCSQPASAMSLMVYCLEHMEEIARRKSSARPLRRVFKVDESATSRPPSPRGNHHR